MKPKFDVGTYVRVRQFSVGEYSTVVDMRKYIGGDATVITRIASSMSGNVGYRLSVDSGRWWWDERLLHLADASYPKHFVPIQGYVM